MSVKKQCVSVFTYTLNQMNRFNQRLCAPIVSRTLYRRKKYYHQKRELEKYVITTNTTTIANTPVVTFGEKRNIFLFKSRFTTHRKLEHNNNNNNYNNKRNPDELKKKDKKRPFFLTWKCFAYNLLLAVPIFYLYVLEDQKKKKSVSRTSIDSVGKPLIGGDFTLINQDGKIVTNRSFKDKFCLLYFGFTYCPDICPQELEKQTIVIEELTKKYGDVIVPIFISVDPKRDTVAQINYYCKSFSPNLVGLTGTTELIKNVAKKFRVFFNENITNITTENGEKPNDYNYLIDHSIIHYLINTEGEFVDFFGKNCTVHEMVEKIGEYLKDYLKNKKEQQLAAV